MAKVKEEKAEKSLEVKEVKVEAKKLDPTSNVGVVKLSYEKKAANIPGNDSE